jgi:hypothetical protein
LPVRLIAPSAKMQTTWPFSSSCRAVLIAATGLAAAADRDGVQHLQQRVHRPVLVVRLVDEEPHEPLDARADQRAVDVRQVVADEQRRAA